MKLATPEEKAQWPAANYVDPVWRGPIVVGLTASTMAVAMVFMVLRFWGKGVLRAALGLDDWMMLIATILSVPVSAIAMASLQFGLGLHIWDLKPEWGIPYGKLAFAADIFFPLSTGFTKISLCLTYLRLFPSKSDKFFSYVLSGFVSIYTIACIFLMIFQCTPIRGYWDVTAQQHCIDIRATLIAIAALNSLSDFLVYLWPAKPLYSLQLPLKQRLGLVCIFSVGSVVCVAGALRIYYLEVYFESYDLLWEASTIYSVMSVEMNLGIICGCLSGVKPVFADLFPRFFGSSYAKTSRPTYATYGRNTGHPESFAFQPLSDVSTNKSKSNKNITWKLESTVENLDIEDCAASKEVGAGGQRSFAWASASGGADAAGESGKDVPHNAIAVNQVVTVRGDMVEKSGATMPRCVDAGSEEWIMDSDDEKKGGKRRKGE